MSAHKIFHARLKELHSKSNSSIPTELELNSALYDLALRRISNLTHQVFAGCHIPISYAAEAADGNYGPIKEQLGRDLHPAELEGLANTVFPLIKELQSKKPANKPINYRF